MLENLRHGLRERDRSRQQADTRHGSDGEGKNHGGQVRAVQGHKSGKFRFRLKAGNGEIIAVGEAYESKAAAKNGIASVQKNALLGTSTPAG